MNIEDTFIQLNTILHQNKIKELENNYENAFITSVIFRNNTADEFNMTHQEKITYHNLMSQVTDAKLILAEYLRKYDAISDTLYVRET